MLQKLMLIYSAMKGISDDRSAERKPLCFEMQIRCHIHLFIRKYDSRCLRALIGNFDVFHYGFLF